MVVERIVSGIEQAAYLNFVDIGSGVGTFSLALDHYTAWESASFFLCDRSAYQLRIARSLLRQFHPFATFRERHVSIDPTNFFEICDGNMTIASYCLSELLAQDSSFLQAFSSVRAGLVIDHVDVIARLYDCVAPFRKIWCERLIIRVPVSLQEFIPQDEIGATYAYIRSA
jgi:SAM-dependent methyltransferase